MSTKTNQVCPNVRSSDGHGMSMDVKRTERFTSTMSRIHRAVHSLEVAANLFPNYGAEPGHMEPITTVRTFAKGMDADIQLLYQMIECDEEPEAEEAK